MDVEEDINVVNDYFSYEHFYVLYCKFWELDGDHDFLLSRQVRRRRATACDEGTGGRTVLGNCVAL